MAEIPQDIIPVTGDGLSFRHPYDREDEADTKKTVMSLIKSLQEWAARNTHPELLVPTEKVVKDSEGKESTITTMEAYVVPIRDTVAIGEIRKVFSESKYLLGKYREFDSLKSINAYIEFLTTQRELDTLDTIRNLEMLSDMLALKLGIKHGFKDKTDEQQPWDRSPKPKTGVPRIN